MNRKIYYIRHASVHHADHSGYARLLDYVRGEQIPNGRYFLPYQVRKWIAGSVPRGGGSYDTESVRKELHLIKQMLLEDRGIAHFLNGERDIRYSTLLKNYRKWHFVATFHKPPEVLQKSIKNYKYLSRLDGAIAVGNNQVDFLKEKLQTEAVEYIPHGVDTTFFSPGNTEYEKHTCLFVGQHLRDFGTLGKAVAILKKYMPDFKLRAVLRKDAAHLLPKSDAIEVFSGISDEQLRNLYRTSAVLLLPLKDSTACNSILEALACGLPIITSDVGGVRGYVNEDCGFIIEAGDARSMVDAAITLMDETGLNLAKRQNARLKSAEYAWETVGKSLQLFYQTNFPANS